MVGQVETGLRDQGVVPAFALESEAAEVHAQKDVALQQFEVHVGQILLDNSDLFGIHQIHVVQAHLSTLVLELLYLVQSAQILPVLQRPHIGVILALSQTEIAIHPQSVAGALALDPVEPADLILHFILDTLTTLSRLFTTTTHYITLLHLQRWLAFLNIELIVSLFELLLVNSQLTIQFIQLIHHTLHSTLQLLSLHKTLLYQRSELYCLI